MSLSVLVSEYCMCKVILCQFPCTKSTNVCHTITVAIDSETGHSSLGKST